MREHQRNDLESWENDGRSSVSVRPRSRVCLSIIAPFAIFRTARRFAGESVEDDRSDRPTLLPPTPLPNREAVDTLFACTGRSYPKSLKKLDRHKPVRNKTGYALQPMLAHSLVVFTLKSILSRSCADERDEPRGEGARALSPVHTHRVGVCSALCLPGPIDC